MNKEIDEIALRVGKVHWNRDSNNNEYFDLLAYSHALLAELAKVSEPVAEVVPYGYKHIEVQMLKCIPVGAKLYTHPPAPSAMEGWTAIHLKTGNEYQVIGEAIDATNTHCNQLMVIYQRDGKTFVREAEEFQEKFKAAAARSKE